MAKSTFAILGFLAVLLMSFSMVSAAVVEDITLTIMSEGTTSSRLTGGNDSVHEITINVNNVNLADDVYINWSVADTTDMELRDGQIFTFDSDEELSGFNLTMPYKSSSFVRLTANVYADDEVTPLGTKAVNVYFNNTNFVEPTVDPILGCTDPDANNYNPDATVGDGSCTYDPEPTTPFLCEDTENPAELEVEIKDIDVEGFGDDEDYWYPLDEIEIEIEIKNEGDDTEDIEILFCLYDVDEDDCIMDEDDVEFSENDFDLDHNDDQTVIITFKINPEDLSKSNDYQIRIGATGIVDDSDSPFDESESCIEMQEDIEIRTNEEFVVLNNINFESLSGFSEDEFQEGSQVRISAEVWNIGDNDLEDNEIFLEIYSNILGINEIVEFDSGIDYLDMEVFEKIITIPSGIKDRTYEIEFTIYDDERAMDNDVYENNEDDKAKYSGFITIKGGNPAPTVAPTLESQKTVGEELVVKTIITNNGDDADFTISATGFESWADLISITPGEVPIKEGEYAEVTIVLEAAHEKRPI